MVCTTSASSYTYKVPGKERGKVLAFRVVPVVAGKKVVKAAGNISTVSPPLQIEEFSPKYISDMVKDGFVANGRVVKSADMGAFAVKDKNRHHYPFLKFSWTGKRLDIHMWVRFVEGDDWQDGDRVFWSAKEQFIKGVESFYQTQVLQQLGDWGDEWVDFSTRVTIHKSATQKQQQFMTVTIGGPAPEECGNPETWYKLCAGGQTTEGISPVLYMPWDHQAKAAKGQAYSSVAGYQATAAHEMGHALGLWDAYSEKKIIATEWFLFIPTKEHCERLDLMDENVETTVDTLSAKSANLMKRHTDVSRITGNDLEMMLENYRQARLGVSQWEYYKTTDKYGKRSEMIIDTTDDIDENGEVDMELCK